MYLRTNFIKMTSEQLTALETLIKAINALAGGEDGAPLLRTEVFNRGMDDDSTTVDVRCNHAGKRLAVSTLFAGIDGISRRMCVDTGGDRHGIKWTLY